MPARKKPIASKAIRSTNRSGTASATPTAAPSVAPPRPRWLEGRAAQIWRKLAPELALAGTLTPKDTHSFAAWCMLAARIEKGEFTAAVLSQFRLMSNDFGLSPSGKGRELGPVPPKQSSPTSRFFND